MCSGFRPPRQHRPERPLSITLSPHCPGTSFAAETLCTRSSGVVRHPDPSGSCSLVACHPFKAAPASSPECAACSNLFPPSRISVFHSSRSLPSQPLRSRALGAFPNRESCGPPPTAGCPSIFSSSANQAAVSLSKQLVLHNQVTTCLHSAYALLCTALWFDMHSGRGPPTSMWFPNAGARCMHILQGP